VPAYVGPHRRQAIGACGCVLQACDAILREEPGVCHSKVHDEGDGGLRVKFTGTLSWPSFAPYARAPLGPMMHRLPPKPYGVRPLPHAQQRGQEQRLCARPLRKPPAQ
jgi:hypothetical protein